MNASILPMELSVFVGIVLGILFALVAVDPLNVDTRDGVDVFLEERRDELQERYETEMYGMDYVEFEDRLAVIEAPGTESIMRDAVTVDGVGPHTAFAIAQYYDGDYDAYRAADADALTSVNGVGENRATALAQ